VGPRSSICQAPWLGGQSELPSHKAVWMVGFASCKPADAPVCLFVDFRVTWEIGRLRTRKGLTKSWKVTVRGCSYG